MAAITQINTGGTTYDVNDKRITTTAITTPTHILGSTSASLTSIAPVALANLAMAMGVPRIYGLFQGDWNNAPIGQHHIDANSFSSSSSNYPDVETKYGILIVTKANHNNNDTILQIFANSSVGEIYMRETYYNAGFRPWRKIFSYDLYISVYDGVFIMCHGLSDNYPKMYKPHDWPAQQNAGEVAEGVVVVEGGHMLVVAPTEASEILNWGSANVAGGGTTTQSMETAYNDWAGKGNTDRQITHAEMSGEGYAPGFCHAYSRVNANGRGLTAGRWWLPSLGEMMMIVANMTKINYALSLIEGATQLLEARYWTSTEYTTTHTWNINTKTGNFGYNSKSTTQSRVRPVSKVIV